MVFVLVKVLFAFDNALRNAQSDLRKKETDFGLTI